MWLHTQRTLGYFLYFFTSSFQEYSLWYDCRKIRWRLSCFARDIMQKFCGLHNDFLEKSLKLFGTQPFLPRMQFTNSCLLSLKMVTFSVRPFDHGLKLWTAWLTLKTNEKILITYYNSYQKCGKFCSSDFDFFKNF